MRVDLIAAVYQSVLGEEAYPSVEEKAANSCVAKVMERFFLFVTFQKIPLTSGRLFVNMCSKLQVNGGECTC